MREQDVLGTVLGRLKYRTQEEAEAVADELSLEDTHSHSMDVDGDDEKETFHMPGGGHDKLNKELTERGREPAPARANMRDMDKDKMSEEKPMGMSDGGMFGGDSSMMSMDGGGMFGGGADGMDPDKVFAPPVGDEDDDGDMEIY